VRAPGAQQVIRVPVNSVGARHLARTIVFYLYSIVSHYMPAKKMCQQFFSGK
jgi:hypothetical protein